MRLHRLPLALALAAVAACGAHGGAAVAPDAAWVGTWMASPQLVEPRNRPPEPGLAGSTLRQVVRLTIAGERLRVTLSNTFGETAMTVASAWLARSRGASVIDTTSERALTFGGQPSVTIAAGAMAISDPIDFPVAPFADLTISLHIASVPDGITGHPGSRATSFLQSGDHVQVAALPNAVPTEHWYVIAGIDVVAGSPAASVVAIGNSITDGRGSVTDGNTRWTDYLARRLAADPRTARTAVLNAGLGGNAVLTGGLGPPALTRLDRDVFEKAGVRWLIVLEGVNDIGAATAPGAAAVVATNLIAGYQRIIAQARAHGVRVYGATILPFAGSQYDSPEREAARQAVNSWIRTSGAWDAVIDFDAVMRDPANPQRMLPVADVGDHLHPGPAGYQMMADAIDLGLFTGAALAARQPTPSARFDWFNYEGQDSIYRVARAGRGQYLNPILAGFYPDPTICRQGEDYYLATSSFAYYPGVPLFTSRDLVHWTQLGHILDRPSQLNVDSAGTSRGIFAPALSCRPGKLWMITTLVDRIGNFLVTATNPAGPWSDPVPLAFDGIDPSLFFDDDGRIYIVHNGLPEGPQLYGQGHRAIWIQEYDSTSHRMIGPHRMIVDGGVNLANRPIWIEAPHLFRKDGWYYLICAEGGTADQHSEVVFRSRNVFGPFEPGPVNPILTQRHFSEDRPFPVTTTGHADFVETQRGEWYAVFLGTRPYTRDTYNIGRETFMLPVTWRDGWPMILPATDTVPYVVRVPNLPRDARPGTPLNGNFTDRDDFSGPGLRPTWMFLRTVRESWYDLTSAPGSLTMRAREATLEGRGQPSFIGRRQQHLHATATTAMRFTPMAAGDKAGLTAFQGSDAWFLISVALDSGRPVVQLEQRAGRGPQAATTLVASAPLVPPADGTVYLRIVARGGRYDFYYAVRPDAWILLKGDADGTILSTKVAGGFIGTVLGLYAYHPGP